VQKGPACHTNRQTCFYTAIREDAELELIGPMA
jgi:phosphoribosyl-AMP cyclohydrolase